MQKSHFVTPTFENFLNFRPTIAYTFWTMKIFNMSFPNPPIIRCINNIIAGRWGPLEKASSVERYVGCLLKIIPNSRNVISLWNVPNTVLTRVIGRNYKEPSDTQPAISYVFFVRFYYFGRRSKATAVFKKSPEVNGNGVHFARGKRAFFNSILRIFAAACAFIISRMRRLQFQYK